MSEKIKVGIVGYGNLGKGVEKALQQNEDFELVAIFTRRDPDEVAASCKLVQISTILEYRDKIDVLILCGGSATDLPEQGPMLAAYFNTVDSFDTHAKIPEYFAQMDQTAKQAGTLSLISTGWDPGLFSLARLYFEAILPEGNTYTFWGKGVSQGHSDAVRRIAGVKDAIQYTIPVSEAIERVRAGDNPLLTTGEKHIRECYVVAEEETDLARIEHAIKTMPNYFADYETTVHFVTAQELHEQHSGMPHGGVVIRTGRTGEETKQRSEFSLALESNPEFTGSVLVAFARAVARLSKQGETGARSVLDIPPAYLSPKSGQQLRAELL